MRRLLFAFAVMFGFLLRAQSDCSSAVPLCGTSNISYTPEGTGTISETLLGCVASENHTAWYTFTVATSGTLTFVITPAGTVDYDWTLFGPNVTCGNLGMPIRCSYASTLSGYLTGLNMTATDVSENASGDGFVKYLDVVAGETYILMVDNFSPTVSQFQLVWGGTATLLDPFADSTLAPHPFIAPGTASTTPGEPNEINICVSPSQFDFTSLSAGILNGNQNFEVTYHATSNQAILGSNPVTTALVSDGNVYYYRVHYVNPNNPNDPATNCTLIGSFKFKLRGLTPGNYTVKACNNNGTNSNVFNLTSGSFPGIPASAVLVEVHYYPTLADLNAHTNEIQNPAAYTSTAPKTIFVEITNDQHCKAVGTINLEFYPTFTVTPATLTSCHLNTDDVKGLFNLNSANVSAIPNATKQYFLSQADALAGSNQILNPASYVSADAVIYVKVTDSNQCYNITTITLKVVKAQYSTVLIDKTICVENTTSLDAGTGFSGYEWSTGATTQAINNIGVGSYYVDLLHDGCKTRQYVKVTASDLPYITNVEVNNNTFTVSVQGGVPPYQYSLDGTKWQAANTFTNVPRVQNFVYVKDSRNCSPIKTEITVPNLINAMTPNGDNVNDVLDYSALSYKKNLKLVVYDRYGKLVHTADRSNGFTWDGMFSGKRLNTATYWYILTWNENDEAATPVKYSGWIMIKNR